VRFHILQLLEEQSVWNGKGLISLLQFFDEFGGCLVKTYLTMWFSSEGASPVEVVERLRSLGFKPLRGYHDHVYDWKKNVDLDDILELTGKIHETLKGLKVLYKIETE
jgi:hypothetical protein